MINQKVSLPESCSVTVLITGRKKAKAKKIIRAAPFESAFITPAFDRAPVKDWRAEATSAACPDVGGEACICCTEAPSGLDVEEEEQEESGSSS